MQLVSSVDMKKITVGQLVKMLDRKDGILYTDHSTQRGYIYCNEKVVNSDGTISKAADVIKTFLDRGLPIPPFIFWSVQDDDENIHYSENEYNLHEGKQRSLSIYDFVKGNISTTVRGKDIIFTDLTPEERKDFLNIPLIVQVNYGTVREEEQSFLQTNNKPSILTAYENLHGAYHGKFFDTFEDYINGLQIDSISKVGRGYQAQYFLYMALGLIYEDRKTLDVRASDILTNCRHSVFKPESYKMTEKLYFYDKLHKLGVILTNNKNKDPEKLCRIVEYVFDKNYDTEVVYEYYKESKNNRNDVGKWDFDVHKTAINALFNGYKCDYRRRLFDEEKFMLWDRESVPTCAYCSGVFEKKYDDNADNHHIIPWAEGGRTVLSNMTLMHRDCHKKWHAEHRKVSNNE